MTSFSRDYLVEIDFLLNQKYNVGKWASATQDNQLHDHDPIGFYWHILAKSHTIFHTLQ